MPNVKFQTTCRLKFQSYRHLHVKVGILAFSLIGRGMRICKVALLDVFSYSTVLFFVCPCVNLLGMGDIGSFFIELGILISSACYYRLIGICQGEQQRATRKLTIYSILTLTAISRNKIFHNSILLLRGGIICHLFEGQKDKYHM